MTRTGKPETVSLTVNGPTRTHGQHTNPTPCAGSGAGTIGRTEHMQKQMNNTEPKFITNVYVHETKLQILKLRMGWPLGSGGNNRVQNAHVALIKFLVGLVIRNGLVASACKPQRAPGTSSTRADGRQASQQGAALQMLRGALRRATTRH